VGVLAVIPARAGSKRVPGKNAKEIAGRPLIAWTIEASRGASRVDRTIVSTEDLKLAEIARKYHADVPFIRPYDLANDNASSIDTVVHAVSMVTGFEWVLLLQPENDSPIIVTNGDLITDINYSDLLAFHNLHEADATMVVRSHELENPFGVVQTQGVFITGFEEKPIYRSQINAGVYVVSTKIFDLVPKNQAFDMPALFEAARLRGFKTIAYPLYESWIDIGRHEDFALANRVTKEN
jgi:NDP-sugar pyrophosphorylase family protein